MKQKNKQRGVFRPCPFCGAIPTIEWEPEKGVKDRTPQLICVLVVKHSRRCFITGRLNNGNPLMVVSSLNQKKLLEQWNGKFIWETKR